MTSEKIRRIFLDFFSAKGGSNFGGNHVVVPSSSLIPDDPSVLLTTAGMQQFKRYFTGELDPFKDFGAKNTASIQKCFRTSDIDEVGDESHLTFFEMLGNFSFGGYFKKEAIEWGYCFLTEEMKIEPERLSATYFSGDPPISSEQALPEDEESLRELKKYFPERKIKARGRTDNFWGPTGREGPCGPTVEFYVDGLEIWNLVFNEYYCRADKTLEKLKTAGVDTGMGLERLAMVVQNKPTIFETDLFLPIMRLLPVDMEMRIKRILADHSRGIVFLISDGVRPSNKEAGYILRRLIRRLITHLYLAKKPVVPAHLFSAIFENYRSFYPELNEKIVLEEFSLERERFEKTLAVGLKELAKISKLDGKIAFRFYESYGLPYEVLKELGGAKAEELRREDFEREFEKHQEISRAGQERKFGGHGLILDTGELKAGNEEELKKVTRLHTATHLLHQALRETLGYSVRQMGSDINVERTRFDFTFPRKLTAEELALIEEKVNQKIKENLPVMFEEMPKEEAEKTGALHFFKLKYPNRVKVYYIGHSLKGAWSKEFCGGPHVASTGEIGRFKIIKEESVAAGVRRIRAVVE